MCVWRVCVRACVSVCVHEIMCVCVSVCVCVCVCVNSMKNKMTYAFMTNINVKNNSMKSIDQDNKATKKTRQENFIDLINEKCACLSLVIRTKIWDKGTSKNTIKR